jgi:hypothetical protein
LRFRQSSALDNVAQGQSANPSVPQFEAASVNRSSLQQPRSMGLSPSGLSYVNVTLADALVEAYGIERY